MSKNIAILVVLTILCVVACMPEEGNYDYKDINEITINDLPETLSAVTLDTLSITPNLNLSLDPNETKSYSYRWVAYAVSGANVDETIELSTERNLNEVLRITPGTYKVYYFVKDNETQVEVQENFELEVINGTYEGWMVLNDVNGSSRLDMVSLVNDEFVAKHDVLALAGSELELKGTPGFVQCYSYAPSFYGVYVSTSGNGTTKIDPDTFEWTPSYSLATEFASSQPDNLEANSITAKHYFKSYVSLGSDIYFYNQPLGILYNSPINNVNGVTFKASKFIGKGNNLNRNNNVILYDTENQKFMYTNGGGSSFNMPVPSNPKFSYNTGMDLLYMESNDYKNNAGNQTFAILKDADSNKFYLAIFRANNPSSQTFYSEIVATDFDQATQFAISPVYGYIFYNVGGKVYQYDPFYQGGTTTLMLDKGAQEISYLTFRSDYKSAKYKTRISRDLVVGYYDPTGVPGGNGTLDFYEVPSIRAQITLKNSFDGFGKIVSVAYRER